MDSLYGIGARRYRVMEVPSCHISSNGSGNPATEGDIMGGRTGPRRLVLAARNARERSKIRSGPSRRQTSCNISIRRHGNPCAWSRTYCARLRCPRFRNLVLTWINATPGNHSRELSRHRSYSIELRCASRGSAKTSSIKVMPTDEVPTAPDSLHSTPVLEIGRSHC